MDVVPPATRSTAVLHRRLVLACALACAAACRPATSPTPPTPAPSPTPASPARAETHRVRAPEEIVATVDGVPIREADVSALARVASTAPDVPAPTRGALVLQLVERRLVAGRAEALGLTASASEVDKAVEQLAAGAGLTTEALRTAVEDTTMLSWEEYRGEIAAQILELRLMMSTLPIDPSGSTSVEDRLAAARPRLLGCLRAQASVSVEDASVELPENPFATTATLTGVRFASDPGLSTTALEAAATTAAAGRSLCEAIPAAEDAMTQLYLESGYVDARVSIPWPEASDTTVLEVMVTPGLPNVLGELRIDQSAVPKAQRLKEKPLLRRLAALGKPGDVATSSRLRALSDAVSEALMDAGLGSVTPDATRTVGPESVRLDLVFRVPAPAPRSPDPQSPE